MITSAGSTGSIQVVSNSSSPWLANNSANVFIGQMRFISGKCEVYDGQGWQQISSHINVTLNSEVEDIINWARQKKAEEYRLKDLASKYPAVKDLKEKLDMVLALVQEEKKADGTS